MSSSSDYRTSVLDKMRTRNAAQRNPFFNLIKSNVRLFELNILLKFELTEAKLKIQKVEQENLELLKTSSVVATSMIAQEKIHELEDKLLKSKDDMIDLQKNLVEQSQQVIQLNKQLKDKNDELTAKQEKIFNLESDCLDLNKKLANIKIELANLEEAGRMWHDDRVQSGKQYESLLEKQKRLEEDNQMLTVDLLRLRELEIERLNKENEAESKKRKATAKQEMEKANQEQPVAAIQAFFSPVSQFFTSRKNSDILSSAVAILPDESNAKTFHIGPSLRPVYRMDCHEGEVNAIKFHRNGKYFATGGGDRKIKLWEYKDNKCEPMGGSLIGSNGAITSIDINNENNLVVGTSFDHACRIWSLNDSRLRHTLTGHTNKLLVGKFMGLNKVVTGSYDRTLKIWDLSQKACIKTLFAGSSCNDAVTLDSQCILSGHLDKKVRFWDGRKDQPHHEIVLEDRNYLLANTRDVNCLKLIDLRMNDVVQTYACDEYKTSCDWSRAIFSPDADNQYICAGSADGYIFIWNTYTTVLDNTLKDHVNPVNSLAWHPQGYYLVSGDSKKRVVVWN